MKIYYISSYNRRNLEPQPKSLFHLFVLVHACLSYERPNLFSEFTIYNTSLMLKQLSLKLLFKKTGKSQFTVHVSGVNMLLVKIFTNEVLCVSG